MTQKELINPGVQEFITRYIDFNIQRDVELDIDRDEDEFLGEAIAVAQKRFRITITDDQKRVLLKELFNSEEPKS